MTELKPCPFCGGQAKVCQWRDTVDPNCTWIECECGAMMEHVHDESHVDAKEKAIKVWNTRVETAGEVVK